MEIPLTEDRWNHSSFQDVRPSNYGYAEPDSEHKSRRRKRPLGFVVPEPPAQPHHSLWAKTTRNVNDRDPIFQVECSCGWESQWTSDWRKSFDGHIYRVQTRERGASTHE